MLGNSSLSVAVRGGIVTSVLAREAGAVTVDADPTS